MVSYHFGVLYFHSILLNFQMRFWSAVLSEFSYVQVYVNIDSFITEVKVMSH